MADGLYVKTAEIFKKLFYATIQAVATKFVWMTRRPTLNQARRQVVRTWGGAT